MMNTHDPIFESLDRLAGIADADHVGDRMPDIKRRVRVARRRKGTGLAVAAALIAVAGVGVSQGLPSTRTAPPPVDNPGDIQSPGGHFTTFDRRRADLDGDSAAEVIKIRVPVDTTVEDQQLQVEWGNGDIVTTALPNTMETSLLGPIDLDDDGDLELITRGGGGETSVTKVFQAEPASLAEVETVDAAGAGASLATSAEPTTWQVHVAADGIYSYRLTDPTTLDFPAPVTLRLWTLEGSTFTLPERSETQCVTFQPIFELGPC